MSLGLYEYFGQVNEVRQPSGLRHPLQSFLTMATFSIMSGFCALQEIATFFKSNEAVFTEMFGLKHGVPGYTQIRTIFMDLDYDSLAAIFQEWASQYVDIKSEDWLAADGKTLRSTVSNYNNSKQNYVAMVGLFSHRLGIVLASERYENGEMSEIQATQNLLTNLLESLRNAGIIISLDALHCQKKQQNILRKMVMSIVLL